MFPSSNILFSTQNTVAIDENDASDNCDVDGTIIDWTKNLFG